MYSVVKGEKKTVLLKSRADKVTLNTMHECISYVWYNVGWGLQKKAVGAWSLGSFKWLFWGSIRPRLSSCTWDKQSSISPSNSPNSGQDQTPSPVIYSQITYKLPAGEYTKTDPKEHRSEREPKRDSLVAQMVNISACNVGDLGSIPGLGRSPGGEHGNPLQYSGLENSMECVVHGVAKSWTWLSTFTHFA